MGFSIYYRSTRPVDATEADAIRSSASVLNRGRTWLSCEPVHFFAETEDAHLWGGSKPNFMPHPDDAAAAAKEPLPDGTVSDLLAILCQISRENGIDWELSHDHAPNLGRIRGGICDHGLLHQVKTLGELGEIFAEMMVEDELPPDDDSDEDDGPTILPFRPRNS